MMGEGGKYLLIPPGYEGAMPATGISCTVRSPTTSSCSGARFSLIPDASIRPDCGSDGLIATAVF